MEIVQSQNAPLDMHAKSERACTGATDGKFNDEASCKLVRAALRTGLDIVGKSRSAVLPPDTGCRWTLHNQGNLRTRRPRSRPPPARLASFAIGRHVDLPCPCFVPLLRGTSRNLSSHPDSDGTAYTSYPRYRVIMRNPFAPTNFDASRASPELSAIADAIAKTPSSGLEDFASLEEAAKALRAQAESPDGPWNLGHKPSERAEIREIAGPGGMLPLRILRPAQDPAEVLGVMLHLHGGGWFMGSAAMSDGPNEAMADALRVAVVSVEYRLAPEAPYPAAPDDCEAAALWVLGNAQREFGSTSLLVGGESAGGHLAANLLLRLRDRHGYTEARGANLVYGVYDLTGSPSQGPASSYMDMFVPDPRLRRDPDVSPLYADLRGLPPALFSVGSRDSLLDDSLFMYARYAAAGNACELAVCPGAPHGYDAFPIAEGLAARARMHEFLANQL